jgi:hypothetical protein
MRAALLCRNPIGRRRNYIRRRFSNNQSSDAAFARYDRFSVRVSMSRYNKYRQNAADCFAVAQQLSNPALKASMLEMAQSWLVLADHAKQSGRGNCKACDLPLPSDTKRRK